MTTSPGVLCFMAKAPLPGRVKTRLAPAFGEQAAADLACSFLVDEVAAASGVGLPLIVATDDVATMHRVLPTDTLRSLQAIWPQGPGKLGSRLEHVTARALRKHEFVVVIGADSPDLPVDLLLRAIALVRAVHTSVILGPAFDGGFYLLGTRVTMNGRFAGVRLGSRHAREDTRRALRIVGLESEELSPWWDVDGPADVAALAKRLSADEERAPATAACLRRLGYLG